LNKFLTFLTNERQDVADILADFVSRLLIFLCERNHNSESEVYFLLQVEKTLSYSCTVGSLRRPSLSTQCHVAVPRVKE